MITDLPSQVTTVVPDHLYAIGGWIRADRPSGWIAKNSSGWLPIQCYVLRDAEAILLIDSGLTLHQQEVREGLTPLMAGTQTRNMVFTRREADTALNLPWIVREFGIDKVQCAGPVDPFDFLELRDEALASEHISVTSGAKVEFYTEDVHIAVGRLIVERLRPSLRMLATDWYYESQTRTLFSSDMWAFITRPFPAPSTVLRPASEDISVEKIVDHLATKFDFLSGTDTRPIAAQIRSTFAERQIERICPTYGCIIEGSSAVNLLIERTIEALQRLAAAPQLRPMEGFTWAPDKPMAGSKVI